MDEEKKWTEPFSHPRWNEPIGGRVIGHKPVTEKKGKRAHEATAAFLNSMGLKLKAQNQGEEEETQTKNKRNVLPD